jgi:hypothetical protein
VVFPRAAGDALVCVAACDADSNPVAAREAWQQALVILDDYHHPDAERIRARIGE